MDAPTDAERSLKRYYAVFCFLIWSALPFGQLGTTTVTAVASAIAVWGTAHAYGPFASADSNERLILLQVFLGIVAMSGLVLAAAIHGRNVAEQRRAADYAVTHALADSVSLAEAAPRILRAVGESLDWPVGALWTVDSGAGALRCTVVWVASGRSFPEFEAATRQRTFRPGVGLPGRVWADGRADGYDLARAVRGAPGGAQICLIALTGYGQAEDRRRAEEAGFDRHLVKPVDERQLRAVLASLPRRVLSLASGGYPRRRRPRGLVRA